MPVSGDDDATAFGPRTQVSAWATWGSARSSVRNRRRVSSATADAKFGGSFLPVAVSIDANISAGAAAVKAARHGLRVHRKSGAGQRLGEHRADNRLAVDKNAIAIEDDHGSLRCFGHAG